MSDLESVLKENNESDSKTFTKNCLLRIKQLSQTDDLKSVSEENNESKNKNKTISFLFFIE